MEYKKLVPERAPTLAVTPAARKAAAEAAYWKGFKNPVLVKEFSSVTSIHFSATKPHDFAVTSSTRVQIYSPSTNAVRKTITRFKDFAFSGCIRDDGKLLVAGDASGLVQVFDLNSRAVLRSFSGHKDTVRVTRFSPNHNHVLSASDDRTVKLWDLPSQAAFVTLSDHTDHVRAAAINVDNPHIVLTGSYDHTVRLYDVRAPSNSNCVMAFSHGAPVESVLILPGSSLVASTGSNKLKIWNILGGGGGGIGVSNHQKTITSSCLDGSGTRILTGSLDGQVKVFSLEECRVVHSIKYPAPILAVAVSPSDTHLAVGMTTGLLSIRKRVVRTEDAARAARQNEALGGGAGAKRPAPGYIVARSRFMLPPAQGPQAGDLVVSAYAAAGAPTTAVALPDGKLYQGPANLRPPSLTKYDQMLRKFQYGEALDLALDKDRDPDVVAALLQELVARSGLKTALGGRDDAGLEPITSFLLKNLVGSRHSNIFMHVTDVILDIYGSVIGKCTIIDELFIKLGRKVREELDFQESITQCLGLLEILLSQQ
ncbi:WD40-repeat-containing domain protein [Zopfochytrium polystomum]|nr:WD40-repeat-containing domain protein [Zopfochytrium polystomum]